MSETIYRNEFAAVEVLRDETANGARLLIRDATSGRGIYLDPLELEALTWMDHRQFAALLDPSWRSSAEATRPPRNAEASSGPSAEAWTVEQLLGSRRADGEE